MKLNLLKFTVLLFAIFAVGCKIKKKFLATETRTVKRNSLCQGFEIYSYKGYSIVKVTAPWPGAKENFTYILQEKKRFQIALSSLPQSNSYQIYNSYFNHARSSIRNVR
jgi:iron complex transport system substrate-binding protein